MAKKQKQIIYNIRDAIRAEMKRRKWTPYRLAKECGMNASSLERMLRTNGFTVKNADKMLECLNLRIEGGK